MSVKAKETMEFNKLTWCDGIIFKKYHIYKAEKLEDGAYFVENDLGGLIKLPLEEFEKYFEEIG